MRRSIMILSSLLLATALVAVAPASHAAGQTFKFGGANTTGCPQGAYTLHGEIANPGGDYYVRTRVTAGSKVYMNQLYGPDSTNGAIVWGLVDDFNGGASANPGTWPLPTNVPVRVDIVMEQPLGTPVWKWSTVIDRCTSDTLLYNGETADDTDKDLVTNHADACPNVSGGGANGCPDIARSLSLKYAKEPEQFKGKLRAKNAPLLGAGQKVSIWKVRPGKDKRIGRATTKPNGSFKLSKPGQPGAYYATAGKVLKPATGQSDAITAPPITIG